MKAPWKQHRSTLIVCSALVLFSAFTSPAKAAEVAIYRGKGTCNGCAEAPERLIRQLGFSTSYVSSRNIDTTHLAGAKLWVQPGGDALQVVTVIDAAKMELLREFVRNGGNYLGICAGAFFADTTVDNGNTIPGLGLLPGVTYDLLPNPTPTVMPVAWENETHNFYFQGGPGFRINQGAQVEVFARYQDGTPAAVQFNYGKGKVILVGPHPEATASWFDADKLPVPNDLSEEPAINMIRRALDLDL